MAERIERKQDAPGRSPGAGSEEDERRHLGRASGVTGSQEQRTRFGGQPGPAGHEEYGSKRSQQEREQEGDGARMGRGAEQRHQPSAQPESLRSGIGRQTPSEEDGGTTRGKKLVKNTD